MSDNRGSTRCLTCRLAHRRETQNKSNAEFKAKYPEVAAARMAAVAAKNAADPERARSRLRWKLKATYGITLEQFEAMMTEQNGLCGICGLSPIGRGKGDVLVVDHCHKRGHVRSLLCGNCNIAIGLLRDDPSLVDRAAAYLRHWDSIEATV